MDEHSVTTAIRDRTTVLNAATGTALDAVERAIDLWFDTLIHGVTAQRMVLKTILGMFTPVYSPYDEADALTTTAAKVAPDAPRRGQPGPP